MSQIERDLADARKRYTHQAYDVTYFGKSPETAPVGAGPRLSGTHAAAVRINIPADVAGAQAVGSLTKGLWFHQVVNHAALSTGTLNLTLPAHEGLPAVTLIAALALNAAGITTLTTPVWVPLTIDRPLTATVTTGTASEVALISLLVTPAETGWK